MRAKIVFLIAVICIVVMIIVGCIDNFKTEEVPTFTPISTTVPTITPTITIDKEACIDKYTEAEEIFKYESHEPELKANESKNLSAMKHIEKVCNYYEKENYEQVGNIEVKKSNEKDEIEGW